MDGYTNPIRRMIGAGLLVGGGILFLFLAVWLLRTGRLVVTLPDPAKTYTITTVNQDTGQEVSTKSVTGGDFSQRLPAGSYEVRVFADQQASSYLVEVPRLMKTAATSVELANQSDRQKLARNTTDCPLMTDNQLFSYTCGWSNSLFRHSQTNTSSYSSAAEYKIDGILAAYAYRDGVLAIRYTDNTNVPVLSFIRDGAVVTNLDLPASFTAGTDSGADYSLILDKKQPESFAIIRKSTKVELLHYTSFESSPVSGRSEYEDRDLSEMVALVDLFDNRFLVVVSESGHAHQDDLGEADKKPEPALVRTFSADDSINQDAEVRLDGAFSQASFCGNRICLLADDRLLVYSLDNNDLTKLGAVNGVAEFTQIGESNTAAYIQGNYIYRLSLDDLSSRLLFTSDRFRITGIAYSGTRLLATSELAGARQPSAHVFVISLVPSAGSVFADDKLPYQAGITDELMDMDYYDSAILATILLRSSALDPATDRVVYDQAEYNEVTGRIIKQLSADGFSAPKYNVNFLVSN